MQKRLGELHRNRNRLHADYATKGHVTLPSLATAEEIRTLVHLSPQSDGNSTLVASAAHIATIAELQPLFTRAQLAAGICTGTGKETRLAFAQWYAKPPKQPAAEIPWHQDRAFWQETRPATFTVWLALDDANTRNGCIWIVPESHRTVDIRPHAPTTPNGIKSCASSLDDSVRNQAIELPKGHALGYHERLVHRSGANGTESWRRALVLGWNQAGC